MNKHTPGPWRYEAGGGHAHNRIVGSESVQISGWPERRGGWSNASYSDRVCENLGDINLPAPAANARLIAAAPALLEALEQAEECLRYASSTFNASNFTDRHGMGPEFRKALQTTVAALAAAKGE